MTYRYGYFRLLLLERDSLCSFEVPLSYPVDMDDDKVFVGNIVGRL